MSNLATFLTSSAASTPEAVAVQLDDYTMTYRQLDDAAARMVTVLREQGYQRGDRVAVMLPNVPAFVVVYYAVLRAGGVVVPMNPLLKGREVRFYLGNSGASIIVAWHACLEAAIEGARDAGTTVIAVDEGFDGRVGAAEPDTDVVELNAEDTAVILYTSGTTGHPKGAELTHANLIHNTAVSADTLFNITPDDVIMGCLPLFHAFGQTCALNATIRGGATLTLLARFDPAKALSMILRDGVTIFEGVPTMYSALIEARRREPVDTSTLRVCVSGGAALPVEVLRTFETTFDAVILEGYGLSETSPVASFNRPDRERKAGSIGLPIDGVEFRLIDDVGEPVSVGDRGEIAIRGQNVMKGYWGLPDETAEAFVDGWFRTGDIATVDEDGYYYLVDRKKDLIIRGGFNVYPREIEEVIYEHPDVLEAAVIGLPHGTLGEEVGAAVVLRPDASGTVEDVKAFVKQRVAAYKYPRVVWLEGELPKGPTGKILRRNVHAPEGDSPG
ncbi:MAG: long-chain fatty acid--CoA ligase [Lapillicoccus sp.]